jgi:hypothetical protein
MARLVFSQLNRAALTRIEGIGEQMPIFLVQQARRLARA